MKRIISVAVGCCLLLLVLAFMLSACGASSVGKPSDDRPSDEELDQMYEQAKTYSRNANFDKAYKLYEKLYEYQYPDRNLPSYSLDEAFQSRKGEYTRQVILCSAIDSVVGMLKRQLKDPRSLVINGINLKKNSSDKYSYDIILDYSAANSFGGMVRDEFSYTIYLAESDREAVYQSLKDWMDSRGATSEDAVSYLISNCFFLFYQSVYDAFAAGTATYWGGFQQD